MINVNGRDRNWGLLQGTCCLQLEQGIIIILLFFKVAVELQFVGNGSQLGFVRLVTLNLGI